MAEINRETEKQDIEKYICGRSVNLREREVAERIWRELYNDPGIKRTIHHVTSSDGSLGDPDMPPTKGPDIRFEPSGVDYEVVCPEKSVVLKMVGAYLRGYDVTSSEPAEQ